MAVRQPLASRKVEANMKELNAGTLHSGSKTGPLVTSPKQAIAIGLSEARAMGAPVPKPRRRGLTLRRSA